MARAPELVVQEDEVTQTPPLWFLSLTAFVCGSSIMIVEILGARVIGPFFGVSLFVWTSLIAVAMVALACGYYIGGILSDKYPKADFLYQTIFLAGLLTIFIPFMKSPVIKACAPLGLRAGSFCAALIMFGPVLFLLGCVSPYLIRLATSSLNKVGKTVGRMYSISTVGSVVGTVLSGYLLISILRLSRIFFVVGLCLILVSLLYWVLFRRKASVLALLLLPLVLFVTEPTAGDVDHVMENGTRVSLVDSSDSYYGSTKVVDYTYKSVWIREMSIDGLIQGGLDLNLRLPTHAYLYFMEFLPVAIRPNGENCLVLGLGAGIIPEWYEQRGVNVDVIDINSDVVDFAKKYFSFDIAGDIYIEDARSYLARCDKAYDYIVMDVFSGDSTPSHLLSLEFFQSMKLKMSAESVLAVNIHGALDGDNFVTASVVRTLFEVFDTVDIYPVFDPRSVGNGNIALMAYDGKPVEVGPEALSGIRIHPVVRSKVVGFDERKFVFETLGEAVILTDDFNPVDVRGAWLHEIIRKRMLADADFEILNAEM